MDIAPSANRFRIAEFFGDRLHGADDIPLRLRLGIERLEIPEHLRREHRARPRAKILRRVVLPRDFPQVHVHIIGSDRVPLAVLIAVLKEVVAWDVATGLDRSGEAAVIEIDVVFDTALAAEQEADTTSLDVDMSVAHRRQAKRVVVPRVLVVSNTNQRLFEELHDEGENLVARQARISQISGRALANGRQFSSKAYQAIVFRLVADLAPLLVIPILFAPTRIPARRLKVSAGIGADPDILPRWRNHERFDAAKLRSVANSPAARSQVPEGRTSTDAPDAGTAVVAVTKAGLLRRLFRCGIGCPRGPDLGYSSLSAVPRKVTLHELPRVRLNTGLSITCSQHLRKTPSDIDGQTALSVPSMRMAQVARRAPASGKSGCPS